MKLFRFYSPGEYVDFYVMAENAEAAQAAVNASYPGHPLKLRETVGPGEVIAVFE